MNTNREIPMKTKTDVIPTVSIDRAYGEHVDNVEVDAEVIAQFLHERGLTDDQIQEIHIHLGADGDTKNSGKYHKRKKRIQTNLLDSLSPYENYVDEHRSTLRHELEHHIASFDGAQKKENAQYEKRTIHLKAKYVLGATALAGIITHPLMGAFTESGALKIGGQVAVGLALLAANSRFMSRNDDPYNVYRSHPEEVRAFDAEWSDPLPTDAVSIDLKAGE